MLKRTNMKTSTKKKKGQSTVEYIILVAAVLAAILVFVAGPFKTAFQDTLSSGTNGMTNMAGRLEGSHGLAP